MGLGGPIRDAQINRVPQGLFDILQLKSNDLRPEDVSPTMFASMELLDFFAHPRFIINLVNNSAVNSAGDEARANIQGDEFWLVYSLTARLRAAQAADVLKCSVGIQGGTGGYARMAESSLLTATAVGQNVAAAVVFPRPLILNSGWDLVAQCEVCDLAAGTTTLSLQPLVAKFGPANP